MAKYADLPENPDGRLAQNITCFARALRKAGVPVGTGRVLDAIRAVELAGFSQRDDFFHILRACFVSKPAHLPVFAQVFRLFWRDPQFLEHMMAMLFPAMRGVHEDRKAQPAEKRAAQALIDGEDQAVEAKKSEDDKIEFDSTLTFSARERLRHQDFEQMSACELAQAKKAISGFQLAVRPLATRRLAPSHTRQNIDPRATFRHAIRRGGEFSSLQYVAPKPRWPDLVAICDISGSMSTYSRIILQFLHALASQKKPGWGQIHAYTFGTRLTDISRPLHQGEVDTALAAIGKQAPDWEGGTRIGECLEQFNKHYSRRVLGRGAVVLLITDGLDRGNSALLHREAERLHLSCRHLIWLNPLLRYDGFAAKAVGVRILLKHVDSFRACHSLASLQELAQVLSGADDTAMIRKMTQNAPPKPTHSICSDRS